ncbi:MOSC domain-containing protein [Cupriavidus taiwanensis]|uniref:MOSC domain-containing protein n=1 Tax=Cupriavidus taiwanensis TaxID=164546 RepID=UPI001572DA32|nr:MOSC domain-containing protein [Cupriavidus taiwanensis]NSX17096.1 MOSC domain-containing protein [Cupriavidus taiwanensis]
MSASPTVLAVAAAATHAFSKLLCAEIRLLEGLGVEGDAHAGQTVKHRSRVRMDPSQPNLRQVHLIGTELHAALARAGFDIRPADLGENITTQGLDLHALPVGTQLRLGPSAVVELTGLRNPCGQIEAFRPGLLAQVLGRSPDGTLIRKAGVMGVVIAGGVVRPGDAISVSLPAPPHRLLDRV